MLVTLDFKKRNATYLGVIIAGITLSAIFYNNPLMLAIIIATKIYLLTGDRVTTVYATVVTLPRDFKAFIKFAKLNFYLILWDWKKMTVSKLFDKVAKKYKYKTAFIMDEKRFTFHDVNELSNQIGSLFKSKNYKKDDTIALLMENCPEYPCIWLGLSKIGCVTALINTNLRKDTLIHSIKVANSKAIIVSDELSSALKDIQNDESIKNLQIYQYHEKYAGNKITLLDGAIDLVDELKNHQGADLSSDIAKTKPSDKMVYIYTSGTTGLPKAAVITNMRALLGSSFGVLTGIKPEDIIYTCIPLYHTAGGLLGVGNTLVNGNTVVLRKKFSASNFWTDCIKYRCTAAQYIGEICRYLLLTPEKPVDRQHNIRIMYGNGLRPQIWKKFVQRFQIKEISEFYGATEGNTYLVNFVNKIGAVGFIPTFLEWIGHGTLIRCEPITGEIIRNANGHCIKCKPGESGLFIGKIVEKIAHRAFVGYTDKEGTAKKIIRDVFTNGDLYFNSGDILVKDILGYYYFKDRTGDTYRWRGENVATSEVEAVISNIVGMKDCVVYGVQIPNNDGKAGMAAILDPDKKIDFEELSKGLKETLPTYSRPLFIRIVSELPMTGTFKLKKIDLQKEGFDLNTIKDEIYFLNSKDGIYKLFTRYDYENIQSGTIRLFILMGSGGNMMLGINEDDIIYNSLPLYHTAGGMLGLGNVLLFGTTMVIRKKFSASNFWTDCIKYECTIAQYIGEICRYLLSSPIKPTDKQHKIRMMFGNGLRQQIWQQFITRFNIEQIGEIYGSTEGNSNLINFDNQIGAIGFVPLVANYVYPVTLIKCDEDSGEPIRDKNGRCIKCAPGEPGVLIGQINSKRAYTAFNGYADRKASEKKILKDVFREGDFFFNSGDILVKDILGYYYFKDRTGDTYRWRGENVATSEVEAVISNVIGLKDCVVYGVEIPHVEGRAGMAAILDPDKKVDMEQLSISIRGSLPPYARPLFIRLLKELPITGTFKLKKRDLQLENYNLDKIKNDPIYYLNSDGIYREFTRDNYDDILNGRARL